ncbi:JmjC domain-containing protein [Streptomyces sp. NPDC020379]|uniref:JmjC domain-containing protein n=1 Tax=Streptomyces sp. NPDC020379 TaxID=3365071 RepID=UPI0037B47EFF
MEHQLVKAVEHALGWEGANQLGGTFARGAIADQQLLARTLSPARMLDLVMRRGLSNPQVRVFQHGDELHPNKYLSPQVTRRGQSLSMVNMLRLGRLLSAGATLVLDQTNVFDPTMEVTCRAWQWWSRERVQANVYLTTGDAAGFDLHFDDHDVLVLQLSGEKGWEVRGSSRPYPLFRDSDRNDEPSEDILWAGTMREGDIMHIPRGHWHRATRVGQGVDGHSLHVTFGFAKRTGVNWMQWMADWSRDDEVFRRDLVRQVDSSEEKGQRHELASAAARLITSHRPVDYLIAHERETSPGRHVPFLKTFGPLGSVVCVTEFRPQILERGETVEVVSSGKKITFTQKALPALGVLLSGQPVNLSQAANTVGAHVETVAEILVEEQLCAPLTADLSSGYTGLVTNAA